MLIELVSMNRSIYDASHNDYKNNFIKDNIWQKIASKMEEKTGKTLFIFDIFILIQYENTKHFFYNLIYKISNRSYVFVTIISCQAI